MNSAAEESLFKISITNCSFLRLTTVVFSKSLQVKPVLCNRSTAEMIAPSFCHEAISQYLSLRRTTSPISNAGFRYEIVNLVRSSPSFRPTIEFVSFEVPPNFLSRCFVHPLASALLPRTMS